MQTEKVIKTLVFANRVLPKLSEKIIKQTNKPGLTQITGRAGAHSIRFNLSPSVGPMNSEQRLASHVLMPNLRTKVDQEIEETGN